MKLNPSSNVRTSLYIITVFMNAMIGALVASGVAVSVFVLATMAGFNAVVALMAGINVTPDQK